jgi:hypothetical protein
VQVYARGAACKWSRSDNSWSTHWTFQYFHVRRVIPIIPSSCCPCCTMIRDIQRMTVHLGRSVVSRWKSTGCTARACPGPEYVQTSVIFYGERVSLKRVKVMSCQDSFPVCFGLYSKQLCGIRNACNIGPNTSGDRRSVGIQSCIGFVAPECSAPFWMQTREVEASAAAPSAHVMHVSPSS